jgi:hypothetical protein
MRFPTIVFLLLAAAGANAQSLPAGCTAEQGLTGRADILHCEPWEDSNWWRNGYLEHGSKTQPTPAAGPRESSIVSADCISGQCLRVNVKSWRNGGGGGAIAMHWPIPGSQQEVYLRYYMKLAPNWSPAIFSSSNGSAQGSGGKFPGLADVRAYPEEQCGNGGAFSNGIDCWSARLKYRDCSGSGGSNICVANATTRLGYYWYLPPATSATNQQMGPFDNRYWGSQAGSCSTTGGQGNPSSSDGQDVAANCGIGEAGLLNDRWYLVELHIKMNTPGQADGVAETWIDGSLKYRKNNVVYRNVGHDNLHVRTVWLNVHAGGEGVGPADDTYLLMDQMVVAKGARPGAFASGPRPLPPRDVTAQ